MNRTHRWALTALLALANAPVIAQPVAGAEIGQVKISKGQVTVERGGQAQPGVVGLRLQASDVLKTGVDGSVGISMADDSLLSLGPNSQLSLDRYEFDSTTNQGAFASSLRRGSLAVVSGRITRQSAEAMTVRTPFAVLGVRGTEFAVNADATPALSR